MATTKEETKTPSPAAPQSARERYRSRYSAAHPDLDLDDEESFYGQANQNLDELENFRESDRQLGEAFDKAPLLAGMVLAAKDGQNPFAFLAENIGPDMDIRELANNPEFSKTMGEALQKFMDKQQAGREAAAAMGKNVAKSFETLKALQQERGMSDETCAKMAKDFFGEYDENGEPVGKESFMQLASKGIVTKGMWEALFDARNHDDDVAAAEDKARATALNEKVQNGLKTFGTGLPSSMSTGGTGRSAKQRKGGFASFGEDL